VVLVASTGGRWRADRESCGPSEEFVKAYVDSQAAGSKKAQSAKDQKKEKSKSQADGKDPKKDPRKGKNAQGSTIGN
jgi:hypothetical protein